MNSSASAVTVRRIQQCDVEMRAAAVEQLWRIAEVYRSGQYTEDGSGTLAEWLRDTLRLAECEARRRAEVARLLVSATSDPAQVGPSTPDERTALPANAPGFDGPVGVYGVLGGSMGGPWCGAEEGPDPASGPRAP